MAELIDGKKISLGLKEQIKDNITSLQSKDATFRPRLVVIQVGERPDSSVYVRMKLKSCKEVGIDGELIKFDADISEDQLLSELAKLNADDSVHGVLVQLPLPKHIDEEKATNAVAQIKDVDGFSQLNMAAIFKRAGEPAQIPCTPKGIMYLLDQEKVPISGHNAVVCGRSDIVGSPLAKLLEKRGATVTIIHSKTTEEQKQFFCSHADILVSAVGVANFILPEHVKPGATVIDVGTNYIADSSRKSGRRMVGDVQFDTVKEKAGKITPVPGGVGPMTVAMVMDNLFTAAKRQYRY